MFGSDDFDKMEKHERKIGEKIVGKCVWLEGRGKKKTGGD